jgi:hypothetical protein
MKIEDVLKELRIPVAPPSHEHHRPGWSNIDCAWCSPGWRHYRLGINQRGAYCSCWACGRRPLAESLAMASGEPIQVVYKLLKEVTSVRRVPKEERKKLILPPGVGALQKPHIKYLEDRGFDVEELIKIWEIRGIGISSSLSWRIFIPIIFESSVVSWTTRSISNATKERYISASAKEESVDHKILLYGEHLARWSIIICEGPTDVWRIGPGAVATFGTAYSREQIAKMASYPLRVVCLDSSKDAQVKADKLCELLSVYPGETYNAVLDADDPGSATRKEIKELRSRFLDCNMATSGR